MALSVKSMLAVAAAALLAAGLGLYCLSDQVVGQESKTSDPFAAQSAIELPAPTTVHVMAAQETASAASPQAEPGAVPAPTSPPSAGLPENLRSRSTRRRLWNSTKLRCRK